MKPDISTYLEEYCSVALPEFTFDEWVSIPHSDRALRFKPGDHIIITDDIIPDGYIGEVKLSEALEFVGL